MKMSITKKNKIPVNLLTGVGLMTGLSSTANVATAVATKTVFALPSTGSYDLATIHLIMAAGICNDDPGWDDFMQTVSDARQEREALYLTTLDE
jgi:hypothetical protein